MPSTLDLAAADLSRRCRAADRERVRHMALSYDRRRHLLAAVPGFGLRGDNHPLDRVNGCWLDTDAHTARIIARAILRRLNAARRDYRHERIALLRVALRGEIANHLDARRRGELFAE